MFDDHLTLSEAAAYIGVTKACLYAWYGRNQGPRAWKLHGRIFYFRADIDAWAMAQVAATTRGGI